MTIINDIEQDMAALFPQNAASPEYSTNPHDDEYHELLEEILEHGEQRGDRTGTGTISIFGTNMVFDLQQGFPLITTKKLHWKSIVHELLWFVAGDTNVKYLQDNGVSIWNSWSDENGDLGPVYGYQWRQFGEREFPLSEIVVDKEQVYQQTTVVKIPGVDQLSQVIERIKTHPECRRLIVSAWNPTDIPAMKLPPCHCFFQFYVREKKYLDLQMYQRSADSLLGIPFNIASYALLLSMVAHVTGLLPGQFHHVFGDAHIYLNHLDQVKEQLSRESFAPPTLRLNPEIKSIFDFKFEDIVLENYQCHPAIKAPIAV